MRFTQYYYDSMYARGSVYFGVVCFVVASFLSFFEAYRAIALALAAPPLTVTLAFAANLFAPGSDDVAIARVWSAFGQVVMLILLPIAAFAVIADSVHSAFPVL